MKMIIKFGGVFLFCIILSLSSCIEIKKFRPDLNRISSRNFTPFFNENKLAPLKTEWKELYTFLKKGHLLSSNSNDELIYISSYQFYSAMKSNALKIYSTPFLQDYDSFIATFGIPSDERIIKNKVYVIYNRHVIDDPCQTCVHDLFGYTFDVESRKLLKE